MPWSIKSDPSQALRAVIVAAEVKEGHVEYVIDCSYNVRSSSTWSVRRRYNDFYRLNANLEPFGFKLGIPPKKFFGNLNPAFIEKRRTQLQEFLDNITIHPLIHCTPAVAQFLELSDETLKEYENHVLVSARNRSDFRLKTILHGCSWRFYKLYALLYGVSRIENPDFFVLSWMTFGLDISLDYRKRQSLSVLSDCLHFLRYFRSPYFSRTVDSYVDTHGIGVITRLNPNGMLRDRLYNSKPEDTFIQKYSMTRDCYVIGKTDAIYIARQLLEVIIILNQLNYPYYNFHCGNLMITEEGIEITDLEFALAGHSNYNRQSMIRSTYIRQLPDMRLFNFAHCLYEMLTGTIVFPDHDVVSAADNVPPELFELICSIIRPKVRLPTVDELISLPLFENVKVKTWNKEAIKIPQNVQVHFAFITKMIENRLRIERANYHALAHREYVNRYLSSDEEKTRRRTIIQEYLRNNLQAQKQEDTQKSGTATNIST